MFCKTFFFTIKQKNTIRVFLIQMIIYRNLKKNEVESIILMNEIFKVYCTN